MNLIDLPTEILIIISDDMSENILPISLVNKEFQAITAKRVLRERKERKERMERKEFFDRVIKPNGKFWDAFHGVQSVKECIFLQERYVKLYGETGFISRARYTSGNTYQVATEAWFEYFNQRTSGEIISSNS